jgi:hypothetical protein
MLRYFARESIEFAAPVVAAWGASVPRISRVDLRCLGTTKSGHPRHPLYVKGDHPLVPFPSLGSGGEEHV